VASHCGIEQAIGVGHSMGAHSMAQAAADRPQGFARLVLFDPVIVDPAWYAAGDNLMFDPDTPHPTIKRKANFASAEAMFERFKDREPYSLFQPRVLRDYCEHGVTPLKGGANEDGVGEDGVGEDGDTVTLACPPEVEASVYMSSRSNVGIHDAAKTVDVPVTVVRAMQTNMMDFKGSPTWKELASVFPKGTDMDRGDMTHFHPFQDPADAARIIAQE
jgi:pimeloyl-ACP methyl ester carboxylesterase